MTTVMGGINYKPSPKSRYIKLAFPAFPHWLQEDTSHKASGGVSAAVFDKSSKISFPIPGAVPLFQHGFVWKKAFGKSMENTSF